MSWDQGVQERDDLPPQFVEWVERKSGMAPLQYITWFGSEPDLIICDFGEAGSLKLRICNRFSQPGTNIQQGD